MSGWTRWNTSQTKAEVYLWTKTQNEHIYIFLVKKHVVHYSTSSQLVAKKKLKQRSGLVLHYWAMVGTVHCSGDRQLHICFFQYLYTFDLLVVCSMLVCININLNTSHTTRLMLCSLQVQSFCLPNTPSLHKIIHYQKSSLPISKSWSLSKIIMSY